MGIAVTSVLSYGFHEMATVYTFILAIIVLLQFAKSPNGTSRWPWKSRRVAFGLLACVPVGALTLLLIFYSEYARNTWFSSPYGHEFSWLEVRKYSALLLWDQSIFGQIGWPVLGLAVVGAAGAFTRDMRWFIWLVLWAVLPTLLMFLKFENPSLARIYLPVFVVLCILAAEGLGVLWAITRHRGARAVADAIAIGALAWCATVTYATYVAGPSHPLFIRGVHGDLPPDTHPLGSFRPIEESLRHLKPTEPVGVDFVYGPLFRVLDIGIPAQFLPFNTRLEEGRPPQLIIAPRRMMEPHYMGPEKGSYGLIVSDTYNLLGLYAHGANR